MKDDILPFTEKTTLSTKYGKLDCHYFQSDPENFCLILSKKPWPSHPFLRIHSSCLFSETFHANDCDCALQLDASLQEISKNGGVLVYLFQEGRGIGLEGKIKAINIEKNEKIDTAAAFEKLGFTPDPRVYDMATEALSELGFPKSVTLATNNPLKITELEQHGFTIVSRFQLQYTTNEEIDKYLEMKQCALNHYEKN